MAQDNSNTTLEMGTSDEVLVQNKKRRTLIFIIGFVAMLVVIAVVVTLTVVFTGGDAGVAEPIGPTTAGPTTAGLTTAGPTTEGPTTPLTTTTTTTIAPTTTTSVATDVPPTDPDLTTTEPPVTEPPPEPLDLDAFINGAYSPNTFNGSFTSGNDVLFRNAYGDLMLFEVDTDSLRILVSNTSQTLQQSSRVTEMSADETHVVLAYSVAPVYRYSFLARYAVVDITTGVETDILSPSQRSSEAFLQNFVWGPSGTALAFVYLNNVYYQANLAASPQQITTNGQLNVIYNGIPDWVYEEEVFGSNNAIWFSADGTRMAFATFDDTNVRIMRVPHFGVPGSVEYQYTQHHEIRYPKPGTTNPTVTVTIRALQLGTSTTFTAPTDLDQPILRAVSFVASNTIAIMWTNRVQTTLRVVLCSEGQTTCSVIYSYTENDGWIDNIPLIFNDLGDSFVTILPQAVDGVLYKQIVQVSSSSANLWSSRDRTNTAHTVAEIMHWSSNDAIWYRATHVNDSAEQHIYSVNANGDVNCFTCAIRRYNGGECLYNDGSVSKSGNTITVNCAGPEIPQTYIYDTNGTHIKTWEDNAELSTLVTDRILPTIVRLSVPVAVGLPQADVQLLVPSDYQNRTNLPLLVYVYGGPDTALVTKQWSIDWGSSLVSRWGIAVATIDGRGSGLKGVSNLFALNRRLGTVEIEDQISVTRYLQQNLPWVDGNRTCIWGWSYGGYASSLALARGQDTFRCAAAVAPVVDWRFYDTIYTERYMDLPQNNVAGYTESSLLTDEVVDAYRNKSYFLIHGTADDNVHYQHAMLISRLLQRRDVYFTQMSYTDEDHGLIGVRPHLYHALEKFLQEHML